MIPWNDGPDWEVNPHFVGHVKKAASVDRPLVLICRSGNRSLDAGAALEKAGFTQVYNILHGFEANSMINTSAIPPPAGVTTACLGSNAEYAPIIC